MCGASLIRKVSTWDPKVPWWSTTSLDSLLFTLQKWAKITVTVSLISIRGLAVWQKKKKMLGYQVPLHLKFPGWLWGPMHLCFNGGPNSDLIHKNNIYSFLYLFFLITSMIFLIIYTCKKNIENNPVCIIYRLLCTWRLLHNSSIRNDKNTHTKSKKGDYEYDTSDSGSLGVSSSCRGCGGNSEAPASCQHR